MFIQDVFFWNDVIYCLYTNAATRYWGVAASSPEGAIAWQQDLPHGVYLGLGIQANTVLVHALTYYDRPNHTQPNCVLRLDGAGHLEVAGQMGTGAVGRLHFAGDSSLILVQVQSGDVEIWNLDSSGLKRTGAASLSGTPLSCNIDLLANGLLALTRKDGSSLAAVSLPSGNLEEHAIQVPEVISAVTQYQNESNSSRGNPVVIPATGSDRNGSLYALLLPSSASAIQTVKLSSNGQGSAWLSFQLAHRDAGASRIPMRLVMRPTEVGMIYTDGAVAWYTIG